MVVDGKLSAASEMASPPERTTESETGTEKGVGGIEEEAGTSATGAGLSLDVAFDIVKNERRRLVLEYVAGRDRPVTLSEFAEHIAAIENDKPVAAITSSERKRVYVGLYQSHLPKMEAAAVIDSTRSEGITLGESADQVLQYVDARVDGRERPWTTYYLTLAVAGLASLIADVALGGDALVTAIQAGVVLGLLGTALAHRSTRT